MNQRFTGPVEQVAAGDIHNYASAGRALTKGERAALNALARQIESEGGDPAWKTWRFLHRVIGVDGVDAMRIEHRDAATELFSLLLRCAQLENAMKADALDEKPAVDQSSEMLAGELRRARRMLNQLVRKQEEEKRRYDVLQDELARTKADADRAELKLSRAVDELATMKRYQEVQRKRLNRQKLLSGFLAALALGVLFLGRV